MNIPLSDANCRDCMHFQQSSEDDWGECLQDAMTTPTELFSETTVRTAGYNSSVGSGPSIEVHETFGCELFECTVAHERHSVYGIDDCE